MKQIDIYRKMTGEERLLHAIQLSRLVRKIAFESIKNDNPHLSKRKILEKYLQRLSITKYGRNRNPTSTRRSF